MIDAAMDSVLDFFDAGLHRHSGVGLFLIAALLLAGSGTVQGQSSPPIRPQSASLQEAGSTFWVPVEVGSQQVPVSKLFGVGFTMTYDTSRVEVVEDASGPFLGSDVLYTANVDSTAGEVEVGVSRKSGDGGVEGFGVVARVKVRVESDVPEGDTLEFRLADVKANDPDGNTIPLDPGPRGVTVGAAIPMQPAVQVVSGEVGEVPEPGDTIAVDVDVGASAMPVSDLFGTSFTLTYEPGKVSVLSDKAGPFLGSDLLYSSNLDTTNGQIGIGVSRKAGAGGVDGSGRVTRITAHVDTGVVEGTRLTFGLERAQAKNPPDSSIALNTSDGVVFANTAPNPPQDLTGSTAGRDVALSWMAPSESDLKHYRIYRDTTPIDSSAGPADRTALDTVAADQRTYTDTTVIVDTTYYYRTTAVDTVAAESAFSEQVQVAPEAPVTDTTAPGPPTALSANTSPESVSLSWTASDSTDVATYRVYRDTAPIEPKEEDVPPSVLAEVPAGQTSLMDATVTVDTTYHYRVAAVDGADNESAFSNEATTTPRIVFSVQEPSPLPEVGSAAQITAEIPPPITPTDGTLFYRETGASSFQETSATLEEEVAEATVPPSAVTERGVEYVLRLSEGDTLQATHPAARPFAEPARLPVRVPEVTASGPVRAETYRMVSVPLQVGDRSMFEVLQAEYGTYDPGAWRLFRWSPADSTYREGEAVSEALRPGEAAWLITEGSDSLSVQGGTSVPADSSREVALVPGWNQVGSPFAFPVAWSEVANSETVDAPVAYDGTAPEGERYQFDQTVLRPWRGAFVFNPQDTTVTLQVPPREADTSGAATQKHGALAKAEPEGYRLQAIATMQVGENRYRDRQTWMGLTEGATPGVGSEDWPKPPSVGPHVRVDIRSEEGPRLARSLKPISSESEAQSQGRGASWDLDVSASTGGSFQTEQAVTVRLADRGSRPESIGRWVLDLDRGTRLPATHGTVEVRVTEGEVRRLRVILGTEAFAEEASEDIGLEVEETKLGTNAPNPFVERTRISYQLAEAGKVRLAVYDVLGRKVTTLAQGKREAGVHRVTLRAQDLASGVYFCRMEAGSYTGTRKLTVVR